MVSDTTSGGRRVLLNRLYAEYADDPAFAAVRAEGGRLVPGDGPTRPRLMLLGEAPGKQEQRTGKPFQGASGRLLNEMLDSVGIPRSEVFITNVVKFRPQDNRDPTPDERMAALPYLRREHQLVGNPPLVVLGKHAKSAYELLAHRKVILPNAKMAVGEWSWLELDGGFPVLPLHHPAYGIYQRANRPLMFEQFKAVLNPPSYTIF